MSGFAKCPYCGQRHDLRYLCDPAKALLDAMRQKAESYDVPTKEFDDPIPAFGSGFGGVDVLMRQFMVYAATVPVGKVYWPCLIFTGQDSKGNPLPKWVLANTPERIEGVVEIVRKNAETAIRAAAEGRGL